MQIRMQQTNALKSVGYTDTVLFLTIGKPDIYQHKSLGKFAKVLYLCDQKLLKLAADLPNLFCDSYLAYQYPAIIHLPLYQQLEKNCIRIYPTDFRCICKQHSYLHRKQVSFLHYRIGPFKLNNSMATQHKTFKNISGESRNDALPAYIH